MASESAEALELVAKSNAVYEELVKYVEQTRKQVDSMKQLVEWKDGLAKKKLVAFQKKLIRLIETDANALALEEISQRTIGQLSQIDDMKFELEEFSAIQPEIIEKLKLVEETNNLEFAQELSNQVEQLKADFMVQGQYLEKVKSICNFELTPTNFYTEIESKLKQGNLTFVKACSFLPSDLVLNLLTQQPTVGVPVSVQICSIRSDLKDIRYSDFLNMRIVDNTGANDNNYTFERNNLVDAPSYLTFSPSSSGNYQLEVSLYGQPVSNSPLQMVVSDAILPVTNSFSIDDADITPVESVQNNVSLNPSSSDNVSINGHPNEQTNVVRSGPGFGTRTATRNRLQQGPTRFDAQTRRGAFEMPPKPWEPPSTAEPSPLYSTSETQLETLTDQFSSVSVENTADPVNVPENNVVRTGITRRRRGFLANVTPSPPRSQQQPVRRDAQVLYSPPPLATENGNMAIARESDSLVSHTETYSSVDLVNLETPVEHLVDAPAPMENHKPDLLAMARQSPENGIRGKLIMTLGRGGPPVNRLSKPMGCRRDPLTKKYVVCDSKNNVVKVFSPEGRVETVLGEKGTDSQLQTPSCVLLVPGTDHVIVKDDKGLKMFQQNGTYICELYKMPRPMGLALDGQGRLLSLSDANKGMSTEILAFDINNRKLIDRYPFSPLDCLNDGQKASSQPRFIDAKDNILAVSDLGPGLNYVYRIDLENNGKCLPKFGGTGKAPGYFLFVSGIQIDSGGNYLVGDAKNNRIQLFDKQGKFVCVLRLDGVGARFPSGIFLTEDSHLMVSCRHEDMVSIYKLQPL